VHLSTIEHVVWLNWVFYYIWLEIKHVGPKFHSVCYQVGIVMNFVLGMKIFADI